TPCVTEAGLGATAEVISRRKRVFQLEPKELLHGLYDRGTVRWNEGHRVRRRLPRRLHSPHEGEAGVRDRRASLHRTGDMYRLRRVRTGLPRRGDLRER